MSRIGKLPIAIPAGVTIDVSANNIVTISGKLGTLRQTIDPGISIKTEDGNIIVERHTEQKKHKSMHGLYRAILANMVKGVSEGFKIKQELIGVGYKVSSVGNVLEFSLGYSHSVFFELPEEIKVQTITERGKPPTIIMECADKQLIGQIAAKIRALRKPEPYKGKGIRFAGEVIRKKAGKTAAK